MVKNKRVCVFFSLLNQLMNKLIEIIFDPFDVMLDRMTIFRSLEIRESMNHCENIRHDIDSMEVLLIN